MKLDAIIKIGSNVSNQIGLIKKRKFFENIE